MPTVYEAGQPLSRSTLFMGRIVRPAGLPRQGSHRAPLRRRALTPQEAMGHIEEASCMESLTVRINRNTHKTLRELSALTNESMTDVLDKAIEAYRREYLLEALNA